MPEPRKYTEAQKKSAKKWDAANLDRVSVAMPKGKKDDIKEAASAAGESMNQYIINAVDQRMERDKRESKACAIFTTTLYVASFIVSLSPLLFILRILWK